MIRVNIFRKAKKSGTGGGIGTSLGNIGGQGSSARVSAYASEAGHATTADKATVAQNLAQNSTDWTAIDNKDAATLQSAKTYADRNFLSKVADDIAQGFVTFLRGIKFGVFTSGPLGTGGAVTIDQNGNSHAEFDYIEIRKTASFRSITILELKHIGGELGLTAGAMTVSKVEVYDDRYRCYFDTTDGKRQVYQEFIVGDQARCQTFQLAAGGNGMTRTKYYWRLVVGVGADFIELSRTDADTGSGEPGVDDNIIQLGYRGNGHPERQSAIILSAVANDAPSMKYYQGINSYNLTNNLVKDDGYDPSTGLFHTKTYGESYVGKSDQSTYMKFTPANGVEIKGKVEMSNDSTLNGANLANTIGGLAEDVSSAQSAADTAGSRLDALSSGAENLLRNSGFTGDYTSESVTSGTEVNAGTQMYSDAFDHWTKTNATAGTNASSASGVAVTLSNGSLTQTLERTIAAGTKCIFSFRGSGTSLTFSLGGYSKTITLGNSVQLYQEAFVTSAAGSTFSITAATGVIMELMLIEGTIPNGNWINSPKDNDKTLAYFQALSFLTDAIENNNTNILGGLILTQLIKVGYMQNSVRQITGGMNGLANNDDSPFLWGGGTLDQAAETIAAYSENPNAEPTAQMAKFVLTHGGKAILNDIIARGKIIATSGIFMNISSPNGNFSIDALGNMACKNAKIAGDLYVAMTKITAANFDSYSKTITYTRYGQTVTRTLIDLTKTGLNIHIDSLPNSSSLSINLPSDATFEGALCRIYNQCVDTAYLGLLVGPYMRYTQSQNDGSVSPFSSSLIVGLGGYVVFQAIMASDGFVDWVYVGGNPGTVFPQPGVS